METLVPFSIIYKNPNDYQNKIEKFLSPLKFIDQKTKIPKILFIKI